MLQQLILFHLRLTLLDSGSLSSAWGTRQRSNCTRQSLYQVRHSAKNTRQKINRQSPICRVSFIGHSAKALPRAPGALGKEKRPSRRRPRWRSLCRVPTLPSWQINSYKHISHIYLIHHIYISSITYISHPSTHPSAHITSITIYITYIIISAQVHPNKSTSLSKSTSASQVYHKSITK